jgi:hypothetical protein
MYITLSPVVKAADREGARVIVVVVES